MPAAFVTGANGFLGLNLVSELVSAGWSVTAMHRPTADASHLRTLRVRRVTADIRDRESLRRVMPEGVDAIFHAAGDNSYWSMDRPRQEITNVDGTRHVVTTALARHAGKVVFTSSLAAFGQIEGPVDEDTRSSAPVSRVAYSKTKWEAEKEVAAARARGLEAVVIRPASMLGRFDKKGWGRMIANIANGTQQLIPRAEIDFCHATEVARAHVKAATISRPQALYVLGGTRSSLVEFADTVAGITTARRRPRPLPLGLLAAIAQILDLGSRVTRTEPAVTPDFARAIRKAPHANPARAERDLGFKAIALRPMVEEAVRWLTDEGEITGRPPSP